MAISVELLLSEHVRGLCCRRPCEHCAPLWLMWGGGGLCDQGAWLRLLKVRKALLQVQILLQEVYSTMKDEKQSKESRAN